MALQQSIVAGKLAARVGETVRVIVDGFSPDALVMTGRLEGQAPDIDASVILTDCEASDIAPGQLLTGRIVAAAGYDVVVAPLPLSE
jgi:ribosomal protein S12 methylthiotransferase